MHEAALLEVGTTNSLINEINFNSTVNRFEYLEELLSDEHTKFVQGMTEAVNAQVRRNQRRRKCSGR